MMPIYDIIVVGGGHAGCEAAAAAANLGSKTLLITMDMSKYGQMSCNPAMGGIAKGQIVREIDALGGYSGIITDKTTIQFRMLNRSKGPAMWSPRSQNDRFRFVELWRDTLENIEKLDLWQDVVTSLLISDGVIKGVKTKIGVEFKAKTVILTNGTFLNGLMHIGSAKMKGGRIGEAASYNISDQLFGLGFKTGRLKTGTPVRIDGRSINFSGLTEQKGDIGHYKFSYLPGTDSKLQQRSCWISYTNPNVHKQLELGFEVSPMFDGTIQSTGPRYCPSIESKLITFADKEKHQLFLEPEGEKTIEYYLNGFSSSLSWEVQYKALQEIPGLENAKIFRPGYAIEYDYFEPTQLHHTLETKLVKNLFFAGQINGTTGYEEAGAQGIMAGINAHLKIFNPEEKFILKRNEAYIGVLIDDLVTKGVDEPYRMFTSRAEFRILLRQDNADIRLTNKAWKLGLASLERKKLLEEKLTLISEIIEFTKNFSVKPRFVNQLLKEKKSSELKQGVKLIDIILRPEISIFDLSEYIAPLKEFLKRVPEIRKTEIIEGAEISMKYEGYINREKLLAQKLEKFEDISIANKFDYDKLKSISTEGRQKLKKVNPVTIGQAKRISGVSPSDINVLLVLLGR
ncbi:MAG: tRNA uridine-5-carboxymethylaminomethyl(34) synthesis enzyme MnmG [Prolixibacteraceae bacterium]|mgnify:CR=1 FL=1|jgi:tRNA uridine 5-carboxymethylaminomethyl modification enzyme|nr:tRNA uridine-5-carboxymethylaminomethyl(34) synthesis enzyme MnmG [Prolixibacteraceae bacterium]MBT6766239.1 tRNA uridine-5-carboxymethylaminomethyl(34) synthesis enzyme MnmG [Prolixibacteraceae bacterium]MBT7000569.1 tRNA uridine-5-carboxymethylaminomethyl(34) synthesis enzyme MnmG [Prolixibacteraceae bacterium]MBT7393517.1 tRNA uridine-5-carboxymethylaminomethyl(34) synthesis enzyme MnmG [Prolixibacteraceae bacterium]